LGRKIAGNRKFTLLCGSCPALLRNTVRLKQKLAGHNHGGQSKAYGKGNSTPKQRRSKNEGANSSNSIMWKSQQKSAYSAG
jgi:hypothetical protein